MSVVQSITVKKSVVSYEQAAALIGEMNIEESVDLGDVLIHTGLVDGQATLVVASCSGNTIMRGLLADERLKVCHYYIPRARVELDDRMSSIDTARRRSMEALILQRGALTPNELH